MDGSNPGSDHTPTRMAPPPDAEPGTAKPGAVEPRAGDPPTAAVPSTAAVKVENLIVRYGDKIAVDRMSLSAFSGQVLALLGPNGAGKTSTVETLEGYRRADGGHVRVLGLDPARDHAELRSRIGVMLQRGGVYPTMSPLQALRLFAGYYKDPAEPEALLDLVSLSGVARTPWRRLSGGEQQRLSLALALVGKPQVAFLDEPTAGVDPEGRLTIRRVIEELRERGVCVVVTTHELAEAEKVADEVVIVTRGRVRARGAPGTLATSVPARIRFDASPAIDLAGLAAACGTTLSAVREERPGEYVLDAAPSASLVAAVATWLDANGIALGSIRASSASLEEAYLEIVQQADHGANHGADDGANDGAAEAADNRAGEGAGS